MLHCRKRKHTHTYIYTHTDKHRGKFTRWHRCANVRKACIHDHSTYYIHAHVYNDYYFLCFCSNPRDSREPLWRLWFLLTSIRPYQGLSKANDFKSEWFRASVVVLRKILCLGRSSEAIRRPVVSYTSFQSPPFLRTLPAFFVSTNPRTKKTRRRIRRRGSSGFLSSVMRYLLTDSKIPRWNLSPVARSNERFAVWLLQFRSWIKWAYEKNISNYPTVVEGKPRLSSNRNHLLRFRNATNCGICNTFGSLNLPMTVAMTVALISNVRVSQNVSNHWNSARWGKKTSAD